MAGNDPNKWNMVKAFVKQVVSQYKISSGGVRIAVVLFSTKAYVILKLNEEHTVEGVLRRIYTLPHLGGSRNMAAGLYVMNHIVFQPKNGDRSDADNIVILMTSGKSTANRDTLLYAKKAKDKGVKIIGIGIGITKSDLGELIAVVSPPRVQFIFDVRTVTKLVYIIHKVVVVISPPPRIVGPPTALPPVTIPSGESVTYKFLPDFLLHLNFLKLCSYLRYECW